MNTSCLYVPAIKRGDRAVDDLVVYFKTGAWGGGVVKSLRN
jgi:hypothetical protein